MPAPPPRSTRRCSTSPQAGAAVLVISQDLDELLTLTDRLAVINVGVLSGTLATAEASLEEIGLLMGGLHGMDEHGTAARREARPCRLGSSRGRELSRPLLYATPVARGGADRGRAASSSSCSWATTRSLALYHFFISPLTSLYGLVRAGAEGGAADPDRRRPRHRLSRQRLEHRRRGPADHGRHRRRRRGARVLGRRRAAGSCR